MFEAASCNPELVPILVNPSSPSDRPLVTVLCGFLGAGKTTLLNHLLTQAEGDRWALVVNDVGAINIDARRVAAQAAELARGAGAAEQSVIELGNGCVCCSIKDELAETLARLALTGRPGGPAGLPFDHIIVETTGVAEPRGIALLFTQRNPFGKSLGDLARLSSLVTVVDAAHFARLWRAHGPRATGAMRSAAVSGPRPIFELLLEQVEVSDLVVLNKCDLISAEERDALEEVVKGLNGRAERVRAEHGQVPREVVIDRLRFDPRETLGAASWLRALNALAPVPAGRVPAKSMVQRPAAASAPDGAANGAPERSFEHRFGLRSVVYQARRSFQRERFESLMRSGLLGVVRAKGFYWLAEQPDEMCFLSVAGDQVRFETLNYWWAALVENGRAKLDDRPEMIRALWVEPMGDRRQELVLIGVGLDEAVIRAALDACLVESVG